MPTQGRDGTSGGGGWDRDEARNLILTYLEVRRRRYVGQAPRPVPARVLARVGRVAPQSGIETRKRRVRELIEDLRNEGVPVAAVEGAAGYWIAETAEDHARYEAALHFHGSIRFLKARADRRSRARADTAGQLGLFPRTAAG